MTRSHHRMAGWLALLMSAWLAIAAVAAIGLSRGATQSVDLRPVAALVTAAKQAKASSSAADGSAADEATAQRIAHRSVIGEPEGLACEGARLHTARISPVTASSRYPQRLYYRYCSLLR